MSRKRKPAKRLRQVAGKTPRPSSHQASRPGPAIGIWLDRLALIGSAALLLVPPWVVSARAQDAFRLPKMLLAEVLAVAALLLLLPRLRHVQKIDWAALWRQPALRFVLPLAAAAALGLATSAYPQHLHRALPPWLLGLACLLAWSLGLRPGEQRWLLRATVVPGVVLALLGILQFHGLYQPLAFQGQVGDRLQVTSLAGGAFDLAAFLLLPCLAAQAALWSSRGHRRWAWAAALAVCGYGMAVTQTLSVLLALAVASVVLWWYLLPRRRVLAALAAVALLGVLVTAAVTPLRERVVRKASELSSGQINRVLSGRFDGWRAAWWMFTEHPVAGVGHGAFRAEYGPARLALTAEGAAFSRFQNQVFFTHAHNDYLQALAEWGLVGLAALVAAGWALWRALVAKLKSWSTLVTEQRRNVAEQLAMVIAVAVLAAFNFPLHLAIFGFPVALLLASVLRPIGAEEAAS